MVGDLRPYRWHASAYHLARRFPAVFAGRSGRGDVPVYVAVGVKPSLCGSFPGDYMGTPLPFSPECEPDYGGITTGIRGSALCNGCWPGCLGPAPGASV